MLKSQGAPLSPAANILYPQGKKKVFPSFIIGEDMGDRGSAEHLALSPSTPILLLAKGDEEKERGGGGGARVRREERKEPLTGDLETCAEQGSSEEYKSQLGYPNTSKTILHISANTFGAGGPGQPQHSHTCTHTRMHTCTHTRRAPSASPSSSSSSSSSTSFSTSPAPLLPPKPFSSSTDRISSKKGQQKVPFGPRDLEPR